MHGLWDLFYKNKCIENKNCTLFRKITNIWPWENTQTASASFFVRKRTVIRQLISMHKEKEKIKAKIKWTFNHILHFQIAGLMKLIFRKHTKGNLEDLREFVGKKWSSGRLEKANQSTFLQNERKLKVLGNINYLV